MLIKSGVLLADDAQGPPATLDLNDSGRYEDRWVRPGRGRREMRVPARHRELELPVAHAEGKFVARDGRCLTGSKPPASWPCATSAATAVTPDVLFPENPNGSQANVAGICDETGRVFGLMPHPERHIDRRIIRVGRGGRTAAPGDGLQLFRNAVDFFAA